ncbi:FKBP-type peptidyl-prolyl cis-trans isomerase, partial [gut metagenome]
MKKFSVLVATAIVAMGASLTSCGDSHKSASLKTSVDSASYAIGISTGAGYKENLKTLPGGEANVDDLIAGFVQAIKGDSSAMRMTPQEAQQY